MNGISNDYGIPFSTKKTIELKNKINLTKEKLNEKMIYIVENSHIDDGTKDRLARYIPQASYRGRKKGPFHINSIISVLYEFPNGFFSDDSGTKYSTRKELYLEAIRYIEEELGEDSRFLHYVMDMKNTLALESNLDDIYQLAMLNEGKEIFYVKPTFGLSETNRLITSNPNLQGKTNEVKSLITAEEGYRIASLDITGQEVHILIYGVLENQQLKADYEELGDPYFAFLKNIDMTPSKDNKNLAKIPILGLMNGQSKWAIKKRVGDPVAVGRLVDLVESDTGFYSKVTSYVNEQIKKPVTDITAKGLIGTTRKLDPYKVENSDQSYKRNAVRNAFFQMTASSIVAECLVQLAEVIREEFPEGLKDFRPILTIHDEFVFTYKEEYEDKAVEMIESYMLPIVKDWARFRGKVYTGNGYVHK